MIPPSFEYAVPKTIPEAITLLGNNPDAKVLAGGHSLIPMMKIRLSSPALLIDINRIDGLSYIREDGGWLKIGAMTREVDLDQSDLIRQKYPLLADTSKVIADPLVRNMATVGGNLAHADPANDHPATMLAYGAQVVAVGPKGERAIPIEKFFEGPFTTGLAHDEVLTEIRIPVPKSTSGGAYFKVERKVGDFATAAVAVQVVDVDEVLQVGEPQLHHRDQAVAAGDQPRLVAEPVEEGDRVVDAGGSLVLERRGNLHGTASQGWWCLHSCSPRPPGQRAAKGFVD